MKKAAAISLLLYFILLLPACGAKAPGIEDMPYPHAPEDQRHMETTMDYVSSNFMSELWDYAGCVVVGYFEDTAPQSHNMNRKLSDPSQEADNFYLEALIYQFHVVSVLKGDISADTDIPLGIIHGQRIEDYTYPVETFRQPDAQSYKLMFLRESVGGTHYYPASPEWWLSSDTVQNPAHTNWLDLDFRLESSMGYEDDPADANPIHLDLTPAADGVAAASAAPRDSYTGAELLSLAEP